VLFPLSAPISLYSLSLHDALPISRGRYEQCCISEDLLVGFDSGRVLRVPFGAPICWRTGLVPPLPNVVRLGCEPMGGHTWMLRRSEEHTSELQSRFDLVCRLLLEK